MRIPEFPAALPIICPAASLTSTSSILYPLITPAIAQSSYPLPSGLKTTGPPLYPALLCPSTSNHDTVFSYFSPLRIPPFVNGNLVLPCSIKKSMAIPSGKPRNLTLWPTVIPPLPTSISPISVSPVRCFAVIKYCLPSTSIVNPVPMTGRKGARRRPASPSRIVSRSLGIWGSGAPPHAGALNRSTRIRIETPRLVGWHPCIAVCQACQVVAGGCRWVSGLRGRPGRRLLRA